jgi:UDP-N-acetylglucosamine acyltransferase
LVGLKRSGMEKSDLQLIKKAFRLLYRSEFLFKDALQELENLGDIEELKHLRGFLRLSQMPGRRGLIPGKGKQSLHD